MRLLLLAAALLCPAPQTPPAPHINVLILTGENTTDWRWTSTWMRSVLEESGRFNVEIAAYPDGTLADRYNAGRFDVLLIDFEGQRWGDPAETNFLELVRGGKGVVAVGNSARAFPDWEEYHDLVGCTWDDTGGADLFGPVAIRGRDQHDIIEGFGGWADHQDVVLLGMQPKEDTHKVFALADRVNPATGAEEPVPVVLIGDYGKGRVVTSTLGHVSFGDVRTQASQGDPQYQQFLIRACEWAATGKTSAIARLEPNTLTAADRAEGWQLLFDGTKAAGWGEYKGDGMPEDRWSVRNGVLIANPVEGDQVLTAQAFEEFEVELEWRVAEGTKTDVRVVPDGGISSDGYGLDRSGQSLRILRPAGEFNLSRIVATYDGVEQWMNGVRVATYRMTPAEWAYRMTGDRPKSDPELSKNMPLLKIVRENEGAAVWFRNIRIRRIDTSTFAPVGGPARDAFVDLFNGQNLEGWTWRPWTQNSSRSPFSVKGGLLHNLSTPAGYLRTDATYGDFEFEFDWRMDPDTRQGGRAGVLLRMQAPKERSRQAVQSDMFWPKSIDLRIGTNEAGDMHAVREFAMNVDRRRFNGLIARRMRNMEHRPGEWNHMFVRLERGNLTVRLNGEVVNAATNVGGAPGAIGLRSDGVPVQFRNIRLRPIAD